MRAVPLGCVTVHSGAVGEAGSLYTHLTVGSSSGPHAGAMFLTWERRLGVADPCGPTFPVLSSDDGGRSWSEIASLADVARGAGNRYQPTIYQLPDDLAHLRRGDLLLAGNAIPADGSFTCLVLYSSTDGGHTWQLESIVDEGGPAHYDPGPASTTTAIWEPDLRLVGGRLHCYLADERRKPEGMLQTITRRSSHDLRSWSEPELICGVADQHTRPGMFIGTDPLPDGRHLAVIELVGPPEVPVHLLTSADGEDWGDPSSLGTRVVAEDGTAPSGTPNIGWHRADDGLVTIVVTGRCSIHDGVPGNRGVLSTDLGRTWQSFELPTPAVRDTVGDGSGYSQSVRWNTDGEIVQATTVRNGHGSHDVVVTRARLEPEGEA